MARQPRQEAYGITVMKAPGGGLVIVGGPIDLSRAESLSPVWTREVMETRPGKVTSEPDNQGRVFTKVVPVLQKVGEKRVHGEGVPTASRRLNKEGGKLLNAALLGEEKALELFESLHRKTKPERKHIPESPKDKRIRAERAMGFLGKSDVYVARALKAAGRSEADIQKYLQERAA